MTFKDRRFCADAFQFIAKHEMIQPQKRYLLAVSGGIDSMVLLHFFQRFAGPRYGCEFAVAHLDHALRPESAEQARTLMDYCAAQQIPVWSTRRTPTVLSTESSLESRARQTRYAWFAELLQTESYDAVVTAHHAQDQAETVLMKWLRGSVGLVGMRPIAQSSAGVSILRSFLNQPRSELEHYHAFHQLLCLEDPSNQEMGFLRNRVRHQLLPWFRDENPRWETELTAHLTVSQGEQDYLDSEAERHYMGCVSESGPIWSLHTNAFLALHPALQRRILKRLLTRFHGEWKRFSLKHIEALIALAVAQGGKGLELPFKIYVKKQKRNLFFEKESAKNGGRSLIDC